MRKWAARASMVDVQQQYSNFMNNTYSGMYSTVFYASHVFCPSPVVVGLVSLIWFAVRGSWVILRLKSYLEECTAQRGAGARV